MNFITLKELKKMVPVASEFKRVPGLKKILEDPVPSQRSVGTVFGTPREGLYVQPDVPAPAQRWFRGGKAAHGMDAERPEVPLPYFEAAWSAAAG